MKTRLTVFTLLLIAVLCGHFLFTLIYSFRDNMPHQANALAEHYMVPCFHQNWKLFAPDVPEYSVQLEWRCLAAPHPRPLSSGEGSASSANSQVWTPWQDATYEEGLKESPRVLETVEQGFCTQLSAQLAGNLYRSDSTIMYDRVVGSPAYASALFYVMKHHELKLVSPQQGDLEYYTPKGWQIRLKYTFTPHPLSMLPAKEVVIAFPEYYPQPR
ncbi:MAG: DUF5819 family protein [Flavobacteriales bacterium]